MNKDRAVRDAAVKLHEAIVAANDDGFFTSWPRRYEELPTINVSETARKVATVQVTAGAEVPDEVVAKATEKATKLVGKEIDKAAEKAGEKV